MKYKIVGEKIKESVGKVIKYSMTKNYGWIEQKDDKWKDVFVSYLDIEMDGVKKLTEGQKVKFDLYPNNVGLIAKNVKVITEQEYDLYGSIQSESQNS